MSTQIFSSTLKRGQRTQLQNESGCRPNGTYWQICFNNALREGKSEGEAEKYANRCIGSQSLWGGGY